ncbi:MAG: VIT domain-containing protein [Anaerolineae bacterium]|nr:VIT domain-containing protein [Anaerolineae bacterium]
MKKLSVILLTVLLLTLAAPAHADGIIIPQPPEGPPLRTFPLTIKYHRVTVTIEDQVVTTHVDQVFVNDANFPVEGTYIFPLPEGATISEFAMWVEGEKYEGKLLTKEEARAIYESYVRRQRDPALLEYVGRGAFQASIFPIPPGEERRIELTYSEILPLEGGLLRYRYPLDTERFSNRPIEDVSISVDITSKEALKAIYSPSHSIAVDRQGDTRARVGYEESNVKPDRDFELYFSVAEEEIGLNLLSYRPEDEDGFFLLLVAPKVEIEQAEVVAKDVLLVLDISGSMRGEKIEQAKAALAFVLDSLQPEDRFNIIAFSTGVRQYAGRLQPASEREAAQRWVKQLEAVGGTDINRALLEALALVDPKRPTILIFLTDGLPTEGVIEPQAIMDNVAREAGKNVRLFTFGVGHDVNTVLLDGLAQAHRGASAYVRPGQSIEEEVSAFYARVSMPVLADLELDFRGVHVEEMYPYPLPDLFAGTQLVVVGRYRTGGPAILTLRGQVNQKPQRFTYEDLTFRREGGEPFIARLWATRKIGYLLDQIRLHGKDPELVDEVVSLSLRYGIATPYTSFLVEEPQAVPVVEAPRRPVPLATVVVEKEVVVEKAMEAPALAVSGAEAVADAGARQELRAAARAPVEEAKAVRHVGERTFIYRSGIWVDTAFDADKMQVTRVVFGSARYFELAAEPVVAGYLALGPQVIFVWEGQAYQITPSEEIKETVPAATPSAVEEPQASEGTDLLSALMVWLQAVLQMATESQ